VEAAAHERNSHLGNDYVAGVVGTKATFWLDLIIRQVGLDSDRVI